MSSDNTNYEVIDFHDYLFYDYDRINYLKRENYNIPDDLEYYGKNYKFKDLYHLDEISIVYKFIKIYYLYGKHNFNESKIFKFTFNELAKKILEIVDWFKSKRMYNDYLQYRYYFRNTNFNKSKISEWYTTNTKFIEELEKFYDIVFKDYKYNGTKINIAKLNKNILDSKRYRIYLKNSGETIYESTEIIDSYVEKYVETKLKQILNDKYFMNFKMINETETIFKGIKISYDELLEIFKEKKLVTDPEYSMLKSNYEPVNYYNNEAVVKDGSLFENMIQDIINFDYEICLLDSKIYSSNDTIKDLEEKFTGFTDIICQLKDEISDLKKEIETLKENNNIENEQREKKTHYNIIIKI